MRILKLTRPWHGLPTGTAIVVWHRGVKANGSGPALVDPKRAETLLALGIAEEPSEEPEVGEESDGSGDDEAPRRKRTKKAKG